VSRSRSLAILSAVTLLLFVLIESVSWCVLYSRGTPLPFFLNLSRNLKTYKERRPEKFTALDPHLGFAHGPSDRSVKELNSDYTWVDGFVIYANDPSNLSRPVILTLGGSTTDGLMYDHSWPEELQKVINERGLTATVVNGGTGGYSTNQELIKLLRDGLTFRPDVVISYSGVNDRGKYSEFPYPMVHPYQRETIEALTARQHSILLPNAVALLRSIGGGKSADVMDCSYGVESDASPSGQYKRNMELMNAVSQSQGARFHGFVQANAYYNSTHHLSLKKPKRAEKYVEPLLKVYEGIGRLPPSMPFLHDATGIFEQHDVDVYRDDGIHATQKGNRVIAEYIFGVIENDIRPM
jgi:lysophospholipase L1-like esterase